MKAMLLAIRSVYRNNRLSVALLAIVLLITASMVTVAACSTYQSIVFYDRLSAELHGADLWLMLTPDGVRTVSEDLRPYIHGIEAKTSIYPMITGHIIKGGFDAPVYIVSVPDHPSVGKIKVIIGNKLTDSLNGSGLMEPSLASKAGLKVGDIFQIRTAYGKSQMTLQGLELDTYQLPYPIMSPGLVFVSPKTFMEMTRQNAVDSSNKRLEGTMGLLGIKLKEPGRSSDYLKALHQSLPKNATFFIGSAKLLKSIKIDIVPKIFFDVFALCLVIASIIILASLISFITINQTREEEGMKACGFCPSQIRWVYIILNMSITFAAAIVGFLIGLWIAPMVDISIRSLHNLHTVEQMAIGGTVFLLLELIVALTTSITVLKRRTGFSADKEQGLAYGSRCFKQILRWRLPLVAALGLRRILVRPLKSSILIMGVCFAMAAGLFTLQIHSAVHDLLIPPSLIPWEGDVFIHLNGDCPVEIHDILQTTPEADSWWEETSPCLARVKGMRYQLYLKGYRGQFSKHPFRILKGRWFRRPGEIVLESEALLRAKGHIGDLIRLTVGGKFYDLRIVGTFRDIESMRLKAAVDQCSFPEYIGWSKPSGIALTLKKGFSALAVRNRLEWRFKKLSEVEIPSYDLPNEAVQAENLMNWLVGLFTLIALIGVFSDFYLYTLNQRDEWNVLKMIGFTPVQIGCSTFWSCLIIGIFGILSGLIMGHILSYGLFCIAEHIIGMVDLYYPPVPYLDIIGLSLGLLGLVIGAGIGPALKAGRIDINHSLRAE